MFQGSSAAQMLYPIVDSKLYMMRRDMLAVACFL